MAHLDHAARDARDLEQVVDQAHEMVHLALHDVCDLRRRGIGRAARILSRCEAGEQRRQRIAQLVAERGQELVLAPIGVAKRLVRSARARPDDRESGTGARAREARFGSR